MRDASASTTSAPGHVGTLALFDGVEELDAVGPWEVLAYWTRHHPEDGWSSRAFRPLARRHRREEPRPGRPPLPRGCPALDVLIHPGGHGTRRLLREPEHLDWIRMQRASCPADGLGVHRSLVYAAAGLLTGRPATTHWASLNLLSEIDPTDQTDVDARFVDDEDLLTSAGVSAGIDMALHLVARSREPSEPARCAAASSTTLTHPSDPAPPPTADTCLRKGTTMSTNTRASMKTWARRVLLTARDMRPLGPHPRRDRLRGRRRHRPKRPPDRPDRCDGHPREVSHERRARRHGGPHRGTARSPTRRRVRRRHGRHHRQRPPRAVRHLRELARIHHLRRLRRRQPGSAREGARSRADVHVR